MSAVPTKCELNSLAQKYLCWSVTKCEVTRLVDILLALHNAGIDTTNKPQWTAAKETILVLSSSPATTVTSVNRVSPVKVDIVDVEDNVTVIEAENNHIGSEKKQVRKKVVTPTTPPLPKINVSKILLAEIPADVLFLAEKLAAKWATTWVPPATVSDPDIDGGNMEGVNTLTHECHQMILMRQQNRIKTIALRVKKHVYEMTARNDVLTAALETDEDEYESEMVDKDSDVALKSLLAKLADRRDMFSKCEKILDFVRVTM
jgi:hypothetical protein